MYLIELTFSHCRSDGEPLPLQQIALAEQKGLAMFCHCFRGGQVQHLVGGYRMDDNRVLIEPSTVIRAYTEEVEQHVARIHEVAYEIACALSQEAVLVTIVRLSGTISWIGVEPSQSVA